METPKRKRHRHKEYQCPRTMPVPPMASALPCSSSWLRNRARPLMLFAPSNPLSFNNGPGQAGGSARSPCVFLSKSNNRTTRPVAEGLCLPLVSPCSAGSGINGLCLSDKKWSVMVSCAGCSGHICSERDGLGWGSVEKIGDQCLWGEGWHTWRSEIRFRLRDKCSDS